MLLLPKLWFDWNDYAYIHRAQKKMDLLHPCVAPIKLINVNKNFTMVMGRAKNTEQKSFVSRQKMKYWHAKDDKKICAGSSTLSTVDPWYSMRVASDCQDVSQCCHCCNATISLIIITPSSITKHFRHRSRECNVAIGRRYHECLFDTLN